jgi:4-hydroxy-4-methyl-2-oxoglutarate aldolase
LWGEVSANIHRALGCVGTIVDGGVRDIDEMTNAGIKVIARRLCVGHAAVYPVRWNCEVEVFGRTIKPGQLIHADKHGFMAIPEEDEAGLLEAARFMDSNECNTVIPACRFSYGKPLQQISDDFGAAAAKFSENVKEKFKRKGEW